MLVSCGVLWPLRHARDQARHLSLLASLACGGGRPRGRRRRKWCVAANSELRYVCWKGTPSPCLPPRPCPQATYTIASVRSLPSLRLVLPGLASSSHSLSPSPATPGHLPFSWLSDLNLSVSLGLDSTPNMFEDERGEARRLSLPCARHIPDQCHCRSWRETLTRSPTLLIARPCHCLTSQAPLGVTPL